MFNNRKIFFLVVVVVFIFIVFFAISNVIKKQNLENTEKISELDKNNVKTENMVVSDDDVSKFEDNFDNGFLNSNTQNQKLIRFIEVSRDFVQRYGSFSNQANFRNLKDLYQNMTPQMYDWVSKNLVKESNNEVLNYYGIKTKVLNYEILENFEDSAKILFTVQRSETTVKEIETYYQKIQINLLKQEENWKIDGAYWKEKINI